MDWSALAAALPTGHPAPPNTPLSRIPPHPLEPPTPRHHGRNWGALAVALPLRTLAQLKAFWYNK